jgi:hypothetical protein
VRAFLRPIVEWGRYSIRVAELFFTEQWCVSENAQILSLIAEGVGILGLLGQFGRKSEGNIWQMSPSVPDSRVCYLYASHSMGVWRVIFTGG